MSSYIFRAEDWDNDVTDVFLSSLGRSCWLKGFDHSEGKEVESFIYQLSELLGLPELSCPEEYQN